MIMHCHSRNAYNIKELHYSSMQNIRINKEAFSSIIKLMNEDFLGYVIPDLRHTHKTLH